MTEGSYDDGNYLVRVRAQVMTRDDSTGGWLPMGGGGLSNVSVRKRLLSSSSSSNNSSSGIAPSSQHASLGVLANVSGKNNGSTRGSVGGGTSYNPGGSDEDLDSNLKHEYLIYGKRISDSSVVLSCPIRKDFQYNKVMPTFHHWKTGDKKFGLTFQTAADARAFDKGVRRAVEDLLEGIGELSCFHDETDIGDDDVFMTLELPVDSRSSSGSSSASGGGGSGVVVTAAALGRHPLNPLSMFPGSMMDPSVGGVPNQSASPYTHPHANHHHLHRMHFIRSSNTSGSNNNQGLLRNQYGGGAPASDQWTGSNNPAVLSGGMGESGILSDSINQQFSSGKDIWVPYNKSSKTLPEDRIEISGEPYSYVQFAKDKNSGPFGSRNASGEHEYSYPVMDALKLGGGVGSGLTGSGHPQQHSSSLKKKNQLHQGNAAPLTVAQQPPLLLPTKCKRKKDYFGRHGIQNLVTPGHHGLSSGAGGNRSSGGGGGRAQCRHCLEMYDKDNNGRGSCEYAPDGVLACINSATCISCAQCMLYHCMSDAEGDFDQHPCSCNGSDDRCQRRWASMALLSLFVPCLWCYLPFKACHTCAVKCGCCGGRHQQSFSG